MRELACLLACWFDGRKRLLSIADAAKMCNRTMRKRRGSLCAELGSGRGGGAVVAGWWVVVRWEDEWEEEASSKERGGLGTW